MNIPPVDLKSKILFIFFTLLVLGSLGAIYVRYMVNRDYLIYAQIPCDPVTEACFTGEDEYYYKISLKKAYDFPPGECVEGDYKCQIFHCSEVSQTHFEIEDDCIGPTQ